jgi:hypothetical protein
MGSRDSVKLVDKHQTAMLQEMDIVPHAAAGVLASPKVATHQARIPEA